MRLLNIGRINLSLYSLNSVLAILCFQCMSQTIGGSKYPAVDDKKVVFNKVRSRDTCLLVFFFLLSFVWGHSTPTTTGWTSWTNYNAVFNFLSTTTRRAGFLVQWHKEFAQNVQLNSHKTNDPNYQPLGYVKKHSTHHHRKVLIRSYYLRSHTWDFIHRLKS